MEKGAAFGPPPFRRECVLRLQPRAVAVHRHGAEQLDVRHAAANVRHGHVVVGVGADVVVPESDHVGREQGLQVSEVVAVVHSQGAAAAVHLAAEQHLEVALVVAATEDRRPAVVRLQARNEDAVRVRRAVLQQDRVVDRLDRVVEAGEDEAVPREVLVVPRQQLTVERRTLEGRHPLQRGRNVPGRAGQHDLVGAVLDDDGAFGDEARGGPHPGVVGVERVGLLAHVLHEVRDGRGGDQALRRELGELRGGDVKQHAVGAGEALGGVLVAQQVKVRVNLTAERDRTLELGRSHADTHVVLLRECQSNSLVTAYYNIVYE